MRTLALSAITGVALTFGAIAAEVAPSDVKHEDGAVAASLTGVAGDPAKGREWFVGRKLGNCLACHENSTITDHLFHGEVGPPLDGVADRWTEAELRGIITNPKMMFDGTIMPAFYKDSGYTRPREEFVGKTILSAQQVEDIIAYLMTLKEEE